MAPGKQSLISDIFKKISNVRNLANENSTHTNTTHEPLTPTTSKRRTRAVRLKPRSVKTLSSTVAKPKKKELNPYRKKITKPTTHQQTLNVSKDSDFCWLGRKLHGKNCNTVRIWSQNFNGISRQNKFKTFAEEIVTLNSVEAQIITITETNLNAHNTYVSDQLSSVFDEVSPGSQHILTSTKTSHSSETLQFGGTLTLSQGHMALRIAKKGSDKYGRYQWTQYFGKKNHLKIYNVYRPVHHTDNTAGDGTVWSQHRELLIKDGTHTDPRQYILDSLLQDIVADQRQNTQVLIVGDFNEDITSTKLNDVFSKVGLVNILQTHIDNLEDSRSYFRGKKILTTSGVHLQSPTMYDRLVLLLSTT